MTDSVATVRDRAGAAPGARDRASRVLFAMTAGAGHFGPLEPFASACRRAGHHVLVAGHASAAPVVARAGLAFRALGEPAADEVAFVRAGHKTLSPMQAMARAAGELYVGLYAAAALPGMLVVRESAEFSSPVAAERLGVPCAQATVGLSTGLPERMHPVVEGSLDDLRTRALQALATSRHDA